MYIKHIKKGEISNLFTEKYILTDHWGGGRGTRKKDRIKIVGE